MTVTARSRRITSRKPLAILAAAGLMLAAAPLLAKTTDRQQPMNYEAVHTDAYNAPNTVTTLSGRVKITQGTLLLTGDVAKIYLNADSQIARVVVTGKPAHIQQLDDSGNLMSGDAATLDYDNIHAIAVLSGNAVVKQHGRGQFSGDKLTYNTQTSRITGQSSGDGLVHGSFLPKPAPASSARPAAKPAAPATEQP